MSPLIITLVLTCFIFGLIWYFATLSEKHKNIHWFHWMFDMLGWSIVLADFITRNVQL